MGLLGDPMGRKWTKEPHHMTSAECRWKGLARPFRKKKKKRRWYISLRLIRSNLVQNFLVFCFPPFAFIGVRSWCFFFIQNFLFWFVRLSFSIRHEENKTPFSIVRRMGGGSPRGRHETLPMPCLSLLFSPFFLFSSLLLLYTEIYIKFLPFSYFLFFPGPPFELSTLQLSSGALEKTCAGCLTFSICVGTGHCLAKRRRRDPRDSVSRTLFGGRFILHPLSNYYNDF